MNKNAHSVVVCSERQELLNEIIRWGEASWWPENSLMRFEKQDKSEVHEGTRYKQKVLLPFAPCWDVEVDEITESGIRRSFLNGMFEGYETVSIKPCSSGLKVEYVMNYMVRGLLNKVLWQLVFERLHNKNIRAILDNLKSYVENKRS